MKQRVLNLLTIAIRIFLGTLFFTSGMSKLTNGAFFRYTMFPTSLSKILEPHGLSLWGDFVAWSEIFIGLLLLSQRFATIGAIMCLPLIINIFVVTVSLKFVNTPYLNAFLITLNLFLPAADYHKIKFLFSDDISECKQIPARRSYKKIDLLCLGGIILCLVSGILNSFSLDLARALSIIGLLIFLICGVWQYFSERNRSKVSDSLTG